ncbi:MAG TPA: threonine/serine exporter family protein, partial [Firmicutes bacterium]|nr:threonine/serine exporter family protein [Bacillota bacterium]
EHYNANSYLSGTLASFLVANFVYAAQVFFPDISAPLVIVGGLMILVPGVAIASAVRDIVQGELLSGTSRAVEAIVIAGTLAAGSAFALGLWRW